MKNGSKMKFESKYEFIECFIHEEVERMEKEKEW